MIRTPVGWAMLFSCLIPVISVGQDVLSPVNQIIIRKMDEVNTSFVETNACVTADRKIVYFMSTRGGQVWNNPRYSRVNGSWYGDADLFYSERTNGNWSAPKNMGNVCNTAQSEDEPISNLEGDLHIFESWRTSWRRTGGPYYRYDSEKGLKSLHRGITRFFIQTGFLATDGATISPDGSLFIFAAGPDLDQDMDLYFLHLEEPNARVQKLSISTPSNERTPFLAADGKTLYFASDGYGGMGGLDVLKATWKNRSFGNMELLDAPVNSAKNDYNFTISASGDWAYMVKNDDLYELDFTKAPEKFKPEPRKVISVPVKDCETNEILENKVVIQAYNGVQGSKVTVGKQMVSMDEKAQSTFITKDGYEALLIDPDTPEETPCLTRRKDVHVYFGFDKAELVPNEDLEKLITSGSGSLNFLLLGMTSSKGSQEYNLNLAESRARAVKQYLISKNVPSDRIKIVVLGEGMSDQSREKPEDRQVIVKMFKK